MTNFRKSGLLQSFVFVTVCLASATLGLALKSSNKNASSDKTLLATSQSMEKLIGHKEYNIQPFEIKDVRVKKQKIILGQKFNIRAMQETGGGEIEDWLENLEFTIKNNSDKRMIYANPCIVFPETALPGSSYGAGQMVYNLDIGVHPKIAKNNKEGQSSKESLVINPSELATFTLSTKQLTMMKKFLSHRSFQLGSLNEAFIRVDYILYDDGMRWERGAWYKPDPADSDKYIRVNGPN